MLNNFFTSQIIVDDSNTTLPDITQPEYALNSIEISSQDVKDVLMHLNIYKACGPDLLSSRLLKEGATAFGRATFNAFQSFLRKMLLSSYLERCN